MFSSKSALILATTAAIALTSFDMRPAQAAPEGGPAIVKQGNGTDEFSSQRKRRRARGVNPAVPLAAFGAIIGTIGAIAASRREREVVYYGGPGPYYAEPQYAPPPAYYYAQPQYHVAPQPYARHHYAQPQAFRHHGGHGFRHHGGPPPTPPLPHNPATYTINDGAL